MSITGTDRENREREAAYQGHRADQRAESARFHEAQPELVGFHLPLLYAAACWLPYGFTRAEAVKGVLAYRMAAHNGRGHGNKAAKRAAPLEVAREQVEADSWFDSMRLTVEDVDALAELRTEGRRAHHHDLPVALNFNEA